MKLGINEDLKAPYMFWGILADPPKGGPRAWQK